MSQHSLIDPISRRRLLAVGGGTAAAGLLSTSAGVATASTAKVRKQAGKLPVKQIQEIVQAEGSVSNGVLSIDVSRSDIDKSRGPLGVEFTSSFEIDGMLNFQPLSGDLAFFNGCLALREKEVQGTVDAIMANGLTFQALHQHFIGMSPQIWFVHWRGVAGSAALARAVHGVLKSTSIPLPQTMPKNPKSPLDDKRLGKILHGQAEVGEDGVVTVVVDRKGKIVIDGVLVSPEAGISTSVSFKPTDKAGHTAAAAPDFAMKASEVQPVISTMRKQGWFLGCLYNQETGETPQLYFSHMLKTGNPYALAAEIRRGLDLTNAD
jgi:Domain of Unknown Function (DUF1259)